MKTRKTLEPADVTAVIDTREQRPLSLAPLGVVTGTLDTGDYSVVGLEAVVRVERKSLEDLVACCGRDRERFEREMTRLMAYPARLLVVEATWGAVQLGGWRGQVTPNVVMGSLLGWMAQGIPVLMAGAHEGAARMVSRFLFLVARRRWRELQALTTGLRLVSDEPATAAHTDASALGGDCA